MVYVDNGEGSFANPDNPEDYLVPGWREFVGLDNFASVFTDEQIRDPFISVFVWTFVYAVLSVLLTFVLGLGLAITLNKPGMKGQRVYRSILIVPYAVPAFLSILVWAGLLNDDFGAINVTFGLDIPWLFDPFWAKVSVLLVNLWLGFPTCSWSARERCRPSRPSCRRPPASTAPGTSRCSAWSTCRCCWSP